MPTPTVPTPTDGTPRGITAGANRGAGSFEIVLSAVIFGLLGYWLDHSVTHTSPWLTWAFAAVGLVGGVCKVYFEYKANMAVHAEERRAARS